MTDEIIERAQALIELDKDEQARKLLMDMLREDQSSLKGWGLLYTVCRNDQEREVCLRHILELKPGDPWATDRLAAIEGAAPPPAPPAEMMPAPPAETAVQPAPESELAEPAEMEPAPAPEQAPAPEPEKRPAPPPREAPAPPRMSEEEMMLAGSEPPPPPAPPRPARPAVPVLEARALKELVDSGAANVKVAAFLKACILSRISMLLASPEGRNAGVLMDVLESIIPPDAPERPLMKDITEENVMYLLASMLAGGGSLSSLAANDIDGALSNLESMAMRAKPENSIRQTREFIVGGLELLVYVGENVEGEAAITHVVEVIGLEGDGDAVRLDDVFVYDDEAGLQPMGSPPAVMNTIAAMGLPVPASVFERDV